MRRIAFIILASLVLIASALFGKGNAVTVEAPPSIYQGDLILLGNNVTVIEGRFDINGSIIVEENATLILRDVMLNFTQVKGYQFNMTFGNPINGNPRLLVENSSINPNDHNIYIHLYGNSSASINKLIASKVALNTYEFSTVSIDHSTMYRMGIAGDSELSLSNSFVGGDLGTHDDSNVNVFNCTLGSLHAVGGRNVSLLNSTVTYHVAPRIYSGNFSIERLAPGFFSYWNFRLNCSVALAPDSEASNIILIDTKVNGWIFYVWRLSNATISNSELKDVSAYDFAVIRIYDSSFSSTVSTYDTSRVYFYNSVTNGIYSYQKSKLWLINSTSSAYGMYDQSEIHVSWYLQVHAVDSIAQDVPLANVTVTFSNSTVAESKQTDATGWAKLTLMEKMMNTKGEYRYENYTVEARYEGYSNSITVNITGNKEVTLSLEDLIIPEFTSFVIPLSFSIITSLAIIIYRRKYTN